MTAPTAIRRIALLAAAAVLLAGCAASPDRKDDPVIAIVPAPARLESATGTVRLDAGTRILVDGPGADAVAATIAPDLRDATGLPLGIEPGGTADARDGDVLLLVTGEGPAPDAATAFAVDESHTIDSADGRVELAAASAAGLFRATQSLRQLLPARPPADGAVDLPAFHLEDAPRFAYRGAMLDVARHFFTVEQVIGYLDAIAMLKLNVLHLHLTDDQGWRLAIEGYPALTEQGGASAVGGDPGGFYTQGDYRRIVEAAAARFITVVPEIDLPGHTNAALNAVPELNPGGVAPEPYTGIEVGFSSLSAAPDEAAATDAFLTAVLGQTADLTPGPLLHVGGDESLSTPKADYLDLVGRITAIGAATGKTLVGWHELGASTELPAGTVGQYWSFTTPQEGATEETLSFVEQGGSVILSPADVAYLDMKYPDDPDGPLGGKLGLLWADGPTTLEEAYAWEPTEVVPGLAESDILGLEAPIWTETARGFSEVEYLAFPRIAAIAELAWSPAVEGARDEAGFHARLAPLGAHWRAMGIAFRPVGGVEWTGLAE
ncbi:family 20 glycosylhydrolase [Agromyces seonyuensis]|uniref:beta-N-acetylhexosaminidase n=1 Tax=Agromyces seonyuensis TaxID=2662446 RepID=A0A6I4P3C5_9MICO|nr:family 20 glycosylhydrolase [Agromyces seonyuensis]MWC00183.1 family 20 glycosylhydrolase [Agromyces seonyuensis]